MTEIPKELLNMLTDFLVCEIGSKAIDGVTYAMALKNKEKDKQMYQRYMEIKKETYRLGYQDHEVFRILEINNGYIFDMDLSIVKQITNTMLNSIQALNNGKTPIEQEEVKSVPEQRRKRDMVSLAKFLKSEFDSGKNVTEVALFSRNSTSRIIINGRGQNQDVLSIRYNAYAVRHWDLETVNSKLLIPAGFRISRMKPCEILPSKTGVSFLLTMEQLQRGL